MSITVNTNLQALKIQNNLNKATDRMNTSMERMSSGSRINSAKDDAAGLSVSIKMSADISGSKIASDNVAIGANLLGTTEGNLNVILSNVQRIRDLAGQAANGTYSAADLTAIAAEATARAAEIDRLAGAATFNSKTLFGDTTALTGAAAVGITLQVGTATSDTLLLDKSTFKAATTTGLGMTTAIATAFATSTAAGTFLGQCDTAITDLTGRLTNIGANQNRLTSIASSLEVQQSNLTSAVSTIRDANVAQESAAYVSSQILQSASATLLVQANSAPQIALTLIKG